MTFLERFLSDSEPFVRYGEDHLLVLALFATSLIALLICATKASLSTNHHLSRAMAMLIFTVVIIWTLMQLALDHFTPEESLPLALCNMIAVLAPWIFWQQRQHYLFEVAYFIVLAGTFQAIVTPDVREALPSYKALKYWLVHAGLVLLIIHRVVALRHYPRLAGIWKTFLCLNLYILLTLPINVLADANYNYLLSKPENPSLFDFFGPWPWYLAVAELLAMALFALVYLPIPLLKKYRPEQ